MLPSCSYGEYVMASQTQMQSRSRKSKFSNSRSTRFATDHFVTTALLCKPLQVCFSCCQFCARCHGDWQHSLLSLTPILHLDVGMTRKRYCLDYLPPKTGFLSPSYLLWYQSPTACYFPGCMGIKARSDSACHQTYSRAERWLFIDP